MESQHKCSLILDRLPTLEVFRQEYQQFYTNDLSGSFPSTKVELVVGLDQRNQDSFVMPVRAPVEVFEDDTLHRQRRAGLYGWAEHGFAVLDTRRVLLGAF